MDAIAFESLTKDYGDLRAVDDVTFSVEPGEIFGYLGPNGAGKTTTIRALLGLLRPTSGTARLLGRDVTDEDALIDAKRRVGYLPANPSFDETVSGERVLDLHQAVKGGARRGELLELFEPPLDRKVRSYSSGERQKLGIVQAFMHDPTLVVMDEPTSGLDPLMQQRFNEFIRDERAEGKTVFLSSHVLSEVRRVCDRVGILREGRLVTIERVAELLGRSGKFVRARIDGTVSADAFSLDGVHDLSVSTVHGPEVAVTGDGDGATRSRATDVTFTYTGNVNDLLDVLAGYTLVDVDVEEAPIEDVFMRFYGEEAHA